jgi:hypothetical protein
MVKIKAMSLLDCRAYITENFGLEAHEKIRAAMRPEAAELVYSDAITPLSWVDLAAVVNHWLVFDDLMGKGDGKLGSTMIRSLANKHFNGIYRIMFKSATPKEVVNKLASIWDRFYDRGQTLTQFVSDTHAAVKIVNCPDLPLHHDKLLKPYMEEILTLAGVANVSVKHLQCVSTGAAHCAFSYKWSEPAPKP